MPSLYHVKEPHSLLEINPHKQTVHWSTHHDSSSSGTHTTAVWSCHWSPLFTTRSEVVLAQPPLLSSPLLNGEEVHHRTAVVFRGANTPLVEKVLAVQRAGAIAVLIVDHSGQCVKYDQSCLPGANKESGELFAQADVPSYW